MYIECITCPQLGKSCDGPNFFSVSATELLSWCKRRKKHIQISNSDLAELSGTPKGTIDRLFSGSPDVVDFKHETMRPILKVLVGGQFCGNPCPSPPTADNPGITERLRECEHEMRWQEDKIKRLEMETEVLLEQVREKDQLLHERRDFLKRKDKAISILGAIVGVCVVVMIVTQIVGL